MSRVQPVDLLHEELCLQAGPGVHAGLFLIQWTRMKNIARIHYRQMVADLYMFLVVESATERSLFRYVQYGYSQAFS